MNQLKITLTEQEVEALQSLVEYCWDSEQRDYEEQESDAAKQNHVFNSLVLLNDLLTRIRNR
jgi:hypothetical protein